MRKYEGALWFAEYDEQYKGTEPFFCDTRNLEIAQILEKHSPQILQEMSVLWENGDSKFMKSYGDDGLQFPPLSWSKMALLIWGVSNKSLVKKFPVTASIIQKNPLVTSCMVSKTAPHSVIKPHCGETNATIRIHLGLQIPDSTIEQCGMQVGNQMTQWKQSKTFAFIDSHQHSVWNNTDQSRYILIVDIIRPEFARMKNFVCARILTNQLFYVVAEKIYPAVLYKTPAAVLNFLAVLLYLPFMGVIFLNNRFGFLRP